MAGADHLRQHNGKYSVHDMAVMEVDLPPQFIFVWISIFVRQMISSSGY